MSKTLDYIREVVGPIRDKYRKLHPDWRVTDSPLKYVDWALDHTLNKSRVLAEYLNPVPGTEVFEFGPGTGYLLYILKKDYGCCVRGCDIPDRPLYKEVHEKLGLDTVQDEVVWGGASVTALRIGMPIDLVIGTQVSFMDDWCLAYYRTFVDNCRWNMMKGGKIVLFPNPRAFRVVGYERLLGEFQAERLYLPHFPNPGLVITAI